MAHLLEKDPLDVEFRKVAFEPSADSILKTAIESQQDDFFKQQQENFCKTFNPDDFKKKISSILDKAIEEDQMFDKQIQDNIEMLKHTLLGKAIDSVFTMRKEK